MTGELILVDDEPHIRAGLSQELEFAGFTVTAFPSARGVLDRVSSAWEGVLVTDVRLPGDDGLTLLKRAVSLDAELPVILITGHGDIPMAVQAIREGAYDFIEKPFHPETVVNVAKRALEQRRLVLKRRGLSEKNSEKGDIAGRIVGDAPAMAQLRHQIGRYALANADVLLKGETGTGKELVARCLHDHGLRADRNFVPINCGALPATIVESELFGHEAGAFTGATKKRVGKFEFADGGTIFLDEIESMPLELQTELLRVLQERSVAPLGSNKEVPIDIRVVAATKVDLREPIAEGKFREDLYFRLNVLAVNIPPLRERIEDVPRLFYFFVDQMAKAHNTEPPEVTPRVFDALFEYDWPGNVRELQNAAARYVLDLDPRIEQGAGDAQTAQTLPNRLAAIEAKLIEAELAKCDGNIKATHEALGIGRRTLHEKMTKYGL